LATALFDKGYLLSGQKQFSAAVSVLNEAIRLDPENPAVHHELGYIFNHLGKYEEAVEMYERAAGLDNSNSLGFKASSLRGMSFSCIERGEFDKAEKLLRESLVIDPGNDKALNELGFLNSRRLRYGEPVDLEAALSSKTILVECHRCRRRLRPPVSLLLYLNELGADSVEQVELPQSVFGLDLIVQCPGCQRTVWLRQLVRTEHGEWLVRTTEPSAQSGG
jgi:tetratricopeptide (TPR) repeat protein